MFLGEFSENICKVDLLSAQRAVSSHARVANSVQNLGNFHEFHGDCGQIVIFNSFAEEDWHATQGDAYRRLSWMGFVSLTHLALNRTEMSLRAYVFRAEPKVELDTNSLEELMKFQNSITRCCCQSEAERGEVLKKWVPQATAAEVLSMAVGSEPAVINQNKI